MNNIKGIVDTYPFWKSNPDLKNVIYLTLCGSHGYGTNNENSDIDVRGVLVETEKTIFGLERFEQFEDNETDTVVYGLKKYIRLCVSANPNALELLGIDEDSIIKTYGKLNSRNNKKDEQSLYKHAMHLIRLLLMGIDILSGKGIITRRTSDLPLLMDIRNGAYRYDEIFKLSDQYYKEFEVAASSTTLPETVDMKAVNELLSQLYSLYY